MMNNIEDYLEDITKDVNVKDCKQCRHFSMADKKPVCSLETLNIDECVIAITALHMLP